MTELPTKTNPPGKSVDATDPQITVVIIEDMREVREGLAALINGTSGFACAGSHRSMEEALQRIKGEIPDVILTDIGLP